MSGNNVFAKTTDIYSRGVILAKDTLNEHIIKDSGHIEMADDPFCITKTVNDPDKVFVSSRHPKTSDVYFAKGKHKDYPDEYVKVVVKYSKRNIGYIVSAWTQDYIGGGIGVLKYDKTTSK
jgi:hypothetical protein